MASNVALVELGPELGPNPPANKFLISRELAVVWEDTLFPDDEEEVGCFKHFREVFGSVSKDWKWEWVRLVRLC